VFPSSDNPEGSAGTPKRRQWSIESAFAVKLDQEKALKLYYNFFIGDIVPAHITDSQNLREFLCYVAPDFSVPSRRKLTRDIGELGEEAKGILSDLLSKVNFVATTADSWSAHNRSFLGQTVHWVNSTSLKREKAVLGIKEVKVQQTGHYLGKAMMELHQAFGLTNKVVGTTTDNGLNYISAFKLFAANVDIIPVIDDDEDEADREDETPALVMVGETLDKALDEALDDDVDDKVQGELPKHH
jgi:hypothetical protein